MFLRKTGVALGAALLTSAVAASGASAATTTTVACTNGVLKLTGAAGATNAIFVADAGVKKYRVSDINANVTLGYTLGGCLAGIQVISQQESIVTLSGTVNAVSVDAGDANDGVNTAAVSSVKTQLAGGTGNDFLTGGNANGSSIWGGAGNDSMTGGTGNDVLAGDTGADTMKGGAGNDTFFAIDGFADTLNGGAGSDTAHVDSEASVAAIETILFT